MKQTSDTRYDYATCVSCGKEYQRIDFFGNPHAILCVNPIEGVVRGEGARRCYCSSLAKSVYADKDSPSPRCDFCAGLR